jgi:SAM-dependent methyltransferase
MSTGIAHGTRQFIMGRQSLGNGYMTQHGRSKYVPALRFHWLTPFYDTVVRITTRERTFKSALIQSLILANGSRVLDVGCGTGTLTLWIKQRHPTAVVTGLDGDSQALLIAANKARVQSLDVAFTCGLSFDLPYPDQSFDHVVSSLFFHHLSWCDKLRTAREIGRVLKPGGQLQVADWGRPSNALIRAGFFLVQVLDGFANTRDHVGGRLPLLFQEAGFESVSVCRQIDTLLGTITLVGARKAHDPAPGRV